MSDRTDRFGCQSAAPVLGSVEGKRVAMVVFSHYPFDNRPRRAAEALVGLGMTVDMICLREDSDPKREVVNAVNVRRVPINRRRGGILGYIFQYVAFLLLSAAVIAKRSLKRRYDLVLAADTLVYLGDLSRAFTAAWSRLRAGGQFLFTVEAKDGEAFELGPKRRYRHSESYLREEAATCGFDVMGLIACSPRSEANRPVEGFAAALQKSAE